MAYPAKYSALNELQLSEEARRTLTRIIRVAFPHPAVPDGPYERMTEKIVSEAQASTWFRVALTQGLLTLDSLTEEHFLDLPDDRALATDALRAALEEGGQYTAETRTVGSDGSVRWVVSRGRVVRDASGSAGDTAARPR